MMFSSFSVGLNMWLHHTYIVLHMMYYRHFKRTFDARYIQCTRLMCVLEELTSCIISLSFIIQNLSAIGEIIDSQFHDKWALECIKLNFNGGTQADFQIGGRCIFTYHSLYCTCRHLKTTVSDSWRYTQWFDGGLWPETGI